MNRRVFGAGNGFRTQIVRFGLGARDVHSRGNV